MNRFAWTVPESEPRLSEPCPRAGHEERTAPKSDKRDVERENRRRAKERGNLLERQNLVECEDLLELGGEDASLEVGRKASRRWRALVLGSSYGWRGLRRLPWFLLGRLVPREGADVEPRSAAR